MKKIISVFLLTVFVLSFMASCDDDKNFDYHTSDLSKYITMSEDEYKNYTLELDIAKPHEMDVDVAIVNLLASDKGDFLYDGAIITSAMTITPGDNVYIWYRGYLLDDNGEEIEVPGMCNFGNSTYATLEIGSGNFIPGFELGLVGKNTGNYSKFVKITGGLVKEGQISYVSYSRLEEGADAKNSVTGSCVRVDFTKDVDSVYGEGFRDAIIGAKIGDKLTFDVTIDGKKHTYSNTTVDFVTECETNPIVVETYFPYDYTTATLRNETAYFEVYVYGVQAYESPEFTDEYVREKLSESTSPITEAELMEYEGATLTEKYRSYAKKLIDEAYEENYQSILEDAMWEHYRKIAEVKKYPESKVQEIYDKYVEDVNYQYEATGGSIENSYTGEYEFYEDVETFAVAYLNLTYSENQDWRDVLYTMSEDLVKERLILYYLLYEEDLAPSEEEFNKEYEAIRQEYIDEYILQYLEYEEKSRDDYTDEEYEQFVADRSKELFDYYDEEYFKETTYYEIALRTFLTWPEVSTLDERRAYPINK